MMLFEPIDIGSRRLANRIVMAPMTTNFAQDGFATDRLINHYAQRAKYGVGLVTVEDAIVEWPRGNNTFNPLGIDHDRFIPSLRRLASVI